MCLSYRKDELIKLISITTAHLHENQDDILAFCSELKFAQRTGNDEYRKYCINWIKILLNTHRHLIDEYNLYTQKLSYSYY